LAQVVTAAMQAPAEQTGVAPEQTRQPAAVVSVPQRFASEAEHDSQVPPVPQNLPAPQAASLAQVAPEATHAPEEQTGVAPEQTRQPAADVAVPQWAASVAEQLSQAPPTQYLPAPHWASVVHTQLPSEHTGVDPVQARQPAGAEAEPQWPASLSEQLEQAPPTQYLPAPQLASAVQTHAPDAQAGVSPEQTRHPAGVDEVPQWFASEARQEAQVPPLQNLPTPQDASVVQAGAEHVPLEQTGVAPEQSWQPAAVVAVPQCWASVAEHAVQVPPSQYLPSPHAASEAHGAATHAPAWHTGVAPEQSWHPAAEDEVPQCWASVAEHAVQAPASQNLPAPQAASEVQPPATQAPFWQTGVVPEHTSQPAAEDSVPQ